MRLRCRVRGPSVAGASGPGAAFGWLVMVVDVNRPYAAAPLQAARLRRIGAATLATLLAACSPVEMLNAVAPTDGLTIMTDVAYAPGPRRSLDIYAPVREDAPVVVFFYGGSWTAGNKALYRFLGAALAARGYLTVV